MNSSTNYTESTRAAFPHSEIPGSQVVSTSPGLIAADHVLLRLSVPEHPPHTLTSLTTKFRVEILISGPQSTQSSSATLAGGRRS
jgi:hypothetical protein